MAITPGGEQMAALIEKDRGGPINMLNLLKFKEFAAYADRSDAEISGPDCGPASIKALKTANLMSNKMHL